MITKHACGLAVPPDDPAAFADALAYLADHPDERRQMGRNARLFAEHAFDRSILAEQWVDWLEKSVEPEKCHP